MQEEQIKYTVKPSQTTTYEQCPNELTICEQKPPGFRENFRLFPRMVFVDMFDM